MKKTAESQIMENNDASAGKMTESKNSNLSTMMIQMCSKSDTIYNPPPSQTLEDGQTLFIEKIAEQHKDGCVAK